MANEVEAAMCGVQALISITAIVCLIYVIRDIHKNRQNMTLSNKVLWIIGAIFFPIGITIIYYFSVGRKKPDKVSTKHYWEIEEVRDGYDDKYQVLERDNYNFLKKKL